MIVDLPNGGFVVDREIAAVIVEGGYIEISIRGGASHSFHAADSSDLAQRARAAVLALQGRDAELYRLTILAVSHQTDAQLS